ncbi:HU-CCDC81 and SPOR domain-containing protein [Sphingobacterium sp. HMA12]|uniref:SMODS-associated NUDIX domain-containing protein n=1 Tax=Sphingobacterium sp. HMA12 TaxID=2050894 RepID=UPI000CE9DA0B|nr:HU-CCDC81 and SPOR domain-containing protein [Sphingobacterium sp. HMA12]
MGLITTIGESLITKGASVVWENRKQLELYWKTKIGQHKKKQIRFSMSGLYKIQIPDTNKYLLVLNRRIENQLQPVGGAYKRYGDDSLFNSWGYAPDNKKNGLDVDEKSNADLRFTVQGKNVLDVLKWFEKGQERETEPRREFVEELLHNGILDSNVFQHFNHKHIRRYSKNLSWSEYFNCYEILVFDVFELLPDQAQKKALIDISKHPLDLSKGYAVVSCDDIEQLRLLQNGKQVARIGQHTKLLINQTF